MEQSQTYPFPFPQHLVARLPPSGQDGLRHVDVKFQGHWDGILVIDKNNNCIGVYASREIKQAPLPFKADDITDVRTASLLNRMMAAVPETILWSFPYLYVVIVGPILLVSSATLGP